MNQFQNSISKVEIQDFILSHENDDVQKLLLKQKTVLGMPTEWIAQQITGRRKAKNKLPTWYAAPGIIFPPALHLEQTSSEATANFKSTILRNRSTLPATSRDIGCGADLTGGFGIDTYFLSKHASQVEYVEPNIDLLEMARHNHTILGAKNIVYHHASAEEFLRSHTKELDFLFMDPSRRKGFRKVYGLADSEPNVVRLQSQFFQKATNVLIKTSPLLDLQQGCRELQHATKVVVVAVENECKELLYLLNQEAVGDPAIEAVDLTRNGDVKESCSFTWNEEKNSEPDFSAPLDFIYEPNAAILKAGAFKWIARKFEVKKLAPNTHLYTDGHQKSFPGRIFRVTEHVKLEKKLKARFRDSYVNILTRNYPISVEEIKKKTGLKEGGDQYLICTQTQKDKYVVVAERVS